MELDPVSWLSSSMESCCQKFFGGYHYDVCMGRYPPDHDDCNVMLFYPDWEGRNEGCVHDGKQSFTSSMCMPVLVSVSITLCPLTSARLLVFARQK